MKTYLCLPLHVIFQNIVNAVGAILDPSNAAIWTSMHNRSSGAMELMVVLEAYTVALARNAPQLFTQPFDAVHPNLSELLVCRMMLSERVVWGCNLVFIS